MDLNSEIFQTNASVYQQKYEIDKTLSPEFERLSIELSQNNKVIAKYNNIYLFSRYNPMKEGKINLKKIQLDNVDVFILLGLGYEIYHIYNHLKKNGMLIVIEKEIEILKIHFFNAEFKKILEDDRVIIIVEDDIEKLKEIISAEKLPITAIDIVKVISSRNIYRSFYEYYSEVSNFLNYYIIGILANYMTIIRFADDWPRNFLLNLERIFYGVRACEFYNKFQDIPAILIAAGPSLDDSIEFLRNAQEKAILIVVDTAYRKLLKNGIIPHFVITVDASDLNYKDFEDIPTYTDTFLMAEILTHPLVFEKIKNRTIFYSGGAVFAALEKRLGYDKAAIGGAGSVANNAFGFLIKLGVRKVVFVGQDLCFPYGITHSTDFYKNYFWIRESNEINTYENRVFAEYLSVRGNIEVETNSGEKAFTNLSMNNFKVWFENTITMLKKMSNQYNFINISEKGARIEGAKFMKAEEVLEKELKIDINIWQRLDSIYSKALYRRYVEEKFGVFLKKIYLALKNTRYMAQQGYKAVKKGKILYKNYEKKRLELIRIYRKLIEIEDFIKQEALASEILNVLLSEIQRKMDIVLKDLEEKTAKQQVQLTLEQYFLFFKAMLNSLDELIEFIENNYSKDLEIAK